MMMTMMMNILKLNHLFLEKHTDRKSDLSVNIWALIDGGEWIKKYSENFLIVEVVR